MTKEQRFMVLVDELIALGANMGINDVFSSNKMAECVMAIRLGHSIVPSCQGYDALDGDGSPVEYKQSKRSRFQYNIYSRFDNWDLQLEAIDKQMLGVDYHYFGTLNWEKTSPVEVIYKVKSSVLYDFMLPRLRKSWDDQMNPDTNLTDRKIRACVSKKWLKENGEVVS